MAVRTVLAQLVLWMAEVLDRSLMAVPDLDSEEA